MGCDEMQRTPHLGMLEPDSQGKTVTELCDPEWDSLSKPELFLWNQETQIFRVPRGVKQIMGWQRALKKVSHHTPSPTRPPHFRQFKERTEGFAKRSKRVDVKSQNSRKTKTKKQLSSRFFSPALILSPAGSCAGTSWTCIFWEMRIPHALWLPW